MVLKIAHRGASGYAPENSVEAFKKALDIGVDIIEFDVRTTKDRQVVVIHDHDLKRTTTGNGIIKGHSLESIRCFHQKNGECIPLLEDVLSFLKNKCICKIDVKDPEIGPAVARIITKLKMENSTIITSRHEDVLWIMHELLPKVRTEMIIANPFRPTFSVIAKAKRVKASIIGSHRFITTRRFVKIAQKNGFEVHVWTVDSKAKIRQFISMGVDGIATNYPDKF